MLLKQMFMTRIFKYSAYLAVIFLLVGCSSMAMKPEQFKVNISTIKMLDSTLMEQRYIVTLRIMNRSRETVHIDGMSFDIELNDKDFASGVSNEQLTVEPFSEGLLKVSVTSTIFGILRQINGLQQKDSQPFKYEISGYVYSNSSILGISFNEQGEIDLNSSAPGRDRHKEQTQL